ncbi:phage immunity repressor protein [Enterobacter asburiae]|nr:phage immunity repressor protein [Enterobacter asburiae]VTN94203.1 phage immunity repressor protein [Klebsiella pneumoniae]
MPLVVNGMKITNKKARQNEFVGLKIFSLTEISMESERTSIRFSIQLTCSGLFFLRCRRLISPFTAVTINCAFVSPSSRLLSNSATTSCGKRALSCCDLLLVEPVAITGSPCVRCDSVYAKKMIIKGLKCDSLKGSFKSEGAIHLVSAKPDSAATLTGLLTKPLYEATKMAKQKCTWLFAAINRSQRNARPVMLRITADNERSARRRLAPDYVLSFAGRIPCGGEHA